MHDEPRLSASARDAINRYLLKWMAIIGFGNLAALGGAIAFMFYTVPDRLTVILTDRMEQRSRASVDRLDEVIDDLMLKVGAVQTLASQQSERLGTVQSSLNSFEEGLSALQAAPNVDYLGVVAALSKNSDVPKLLQATQLACSKSNMQQVCRCNGDFSGDLETRVIVCLDFCPDGRVVDFRIREAKAAKDMPGCGRDFSRPSPVVQAN